MSRGRWSKLFFGGGGGFESDVRHCRQLPARRPAFRASVIRQFGWFRFGDSHTVAKRLFVSRGLVVFWFRRRR